MNVIPGELKGVLIFEPKVFGDERGFFMETWNRARYRDAGVIEDFVQDNLSSSRRGILRGLHFQNPMAQGKLVSCVQGSVYDVAVDMRTASPTFGRWQAVELSERNKRQFYIPPGFAHGFQVVSETALFHYKCTEVYSPLNERTLRWDDPKLGIPWPVPDPVLSEKDRKGLLLSQFQPELLF